MSRASEWAYRAVQAQAGQPKFECATWSTRWNEEARKEEPTTELEVVAVVRPDLKVRLTGSDLSQADACALARWILAVFSDERSEEASA